MHVTNDLKENNKASFESIKMSSLSDQETVKPLKPPKPQILVKPGIYNERSEMSSISSLKIPSPTSIPRMKIDSSSQESTISKISESEERNPYTKFVN